MPSPSPGKCRGSVVRQLSLQNQTPLQSPNGRRGLKKQFSEDDTRILDSVEITGQGWSPGRTQPGSILRIGNSDGKVGQRITGTRPKPVKVAWADRKQDSLEYPTGVEVIATKCQGQPRPLSVKAQRLKSPLVGDKNTLVYTRLQLAERLRNAWKERDKTKPNLNIFLAHSGRNRQDGLASDRTHNDDTLTETASTLSDSSAPDKKRKAMQVQRFSQSFCLPETYRTDNPPQKGYKFQDSYFNTTDQKEVPNQLEKTKDAKKEDVGRHLQELNKMDDRVTEKDTKVPEVEESKEGLTKSDSEDLLLGGKRCKNKENIENLVETTEVDTPTDEKPKEVLTAQDRRASFRRSGIVHKKIAESFLTKEEEEEEEVVEEEEEEVICDGTEKIKIVIAKGSTNQKKPPLVRALSAPTQNEEIELKPSQTKSNQPAKTSPPRKLQPTVSFDLPSTTATAEPTGLRDRVKSAPVRRRLKTPGSRRKNKDKPDSSEDEKEAKETKKTSRRRQISKNAGDIVTMVSLVSPAASDTEDSIINLPMESWTGDDKDDSTQPSSSSSSTLETSNPPSCFVVQKLVNLRKTTKTVSFQSTPVLNRSYSASFPSRRVPAGTPIIIPTPVVTKPALTPAQLQEREKRPQLFSAVNPGGDGRGIKRRLIRSSTELPKEDDSSDDNPKISSGLKILEEISKDSAEKYEREEKEEVKIDGEPELKSPKEKECWNLYQKMIEKGVSVSFDTVLRGMLTPTEYRLRKNNLLSTC